MDRRIREYQTTLEATNGSHFHVDYRLRAAIGVSLEEAAFNILSVSSVGSLAVVPYQRGYGRQLIESSVLEFGGYQLLQHDSGSVTIAYPLEHCTQDESLPGLLQLIGAGAEYSYTQEYWIERLTLPPGFVARYKGPRFGAKAWRSRLGVEHRAVLGLTVGPRFGIKLTDVIEGAADALEGGCDFICDDVLLNDPIGEMSFAERVPQFVSVARDASKATKSKKSYFCFILATPKRTLERAVWAVEQGVDGIITNAAALGLGGLEDLVSGLESADRGVPVISTNMGIALMSRAPAGDAQRLSQTGMSEAVFAKLCRLAGADGVHTGTVGAECYGEMEWNRTKHAVTEPLGNIKSCFAIAAGNLKLDQLWANISHLGPDVLLEVSSGILNYKGGAREGARAFKRVVEVLDPRQMGDRDADEAISKLAAKDAVMRHALDG